MPAARSAQREWSDAMPALLRRLLHPFTPKGGDVQLPQRVVREFERSQYRAELLVTLVQLVIAALLAALYHSTPPGFSPAHRSRRCRWA